MVNQLRVLYWRLRLWLTVKRYGMDAFREALIKHGWTIERDILVRHGRTETTYVKGTSRFTIYEEYEFTRE